MKKHKISLSEVFLYLYYIWYFLPFCRAYFSASVYKYVFFSCFLMGVALSVIENKGIVHGTKNLSVIASLSYFFVFTLLYVLNVGDAAAHIKVSFTFWGTLFVYFFCMDQAKRIRMGKLLTFLFIVTCITSSIGVMTDNRAARTIANADADETKQMSYKLKNIANIYLFQGLVICIPGIIAIMIKTKKRLLGLAIIIVIFLTLVNASFTISILMFFASLVITAIAFGKNRSKIVIIFVFLTVFLGLAIWGGDIFMSIAETITNPKISERLYDLGRLLNGGGQVAGNSDVGLRVELYKSSIDTFAKHILGIGPYYSYIKFENGIGYHSQIFDDLARYGIMAILFYFLFFVGYNKWLRFEWKKINCEQTALATTFIYFLFLVLNIGFRSSEESVLILFILPVIPELIKSSRFFPIND